MLLQCGISSAFAQVKIVALGLPQPWVLQLLQMIRPGWPVTDPVRKNTGPLNPDTVVYQVGEYGFSTYQVMPDGYVSLFRTRPAPGSGKNITTALSYHPDVVIIGPAQQ